MATIRGLFFHARRLSSHLQLLLLSSSHPTPSLPFSSSSSSSQPSPLNPTSAPDDVNQICRVLSDFRAPHHDLESALHCFSPKISTHLVDHVLKRCKNLGFSAHRFYIWASNLPNFSHSRDAHHVLVDILGSTKQFALIWDFLAQIRDTLDHEITYEMFWIVFRAYCRANLASGAIRAFKKMGEFGLKPRIDDVDQLLYLLCKKGFVREGQEFFESVKIGFLASVKTYSILMRGWCDLGDSVEAQKLFDEMSQRGCSIDVIAYNALLEALCKGGKVDEAFRLFREMGSRDLKPNACTYSIFIRAACRANDVNSAMRVLDRMRRYDLEPNVFTYNGILKLLCKNQKVDEAYQLLDEMVERGVSPDIWSYNVIQAHHCDHNEVNKSLRMIRRMEKEGCLPDRHTYNMALKMLIRVGRFDRTMELWESMEKRGFYASVSTYAVMIHGLCRKKGRLEDACNYFEMMIDEGIPPYSCTCELLKEHLLQLGFWEKIEILNGKMQRSSSCSIQELSEIMTCGEARLRRQRQKEERRKRRN
ncbi:hypothetical protein Syun_011116 [Stephania yunnanensis]|uniref:Pentatricopeptide repeat-containing protein n=1 Tax=Stephania yunnanensis TaxID=152371 RepID=A0AAP0PI68_9MAGN